VLPSFPPRLLIIPRNYRNKADLMRRLGNRWSLSLMPLAVWPPATTQTRARVSPVVYPKVFLYLMPFPPQPFIMEGWGRNGIRRKGSIFPHLVTASEYAGLHHEHLTLYLEHNENVLFPVLVVVVVDKQSWIRLGSHGQHNMFELWGWYDQLFIISGTLPWLYEVWPWHVTPLL